MFAYYYWIIFVCSNQCDYKQSMKKNDADDENKEKFVRLCHRSKTIINVIIDIKFLSFSTVGDCQQRQKIIMIPIISEMEILLWREKRSQNRTIELSRYWERKKEKSVTLHCIEIRTLRWKEKLLKKKLEERWCCDNQKRQWRKKNEFNDIELFGKKRPPLKKKAKMSSFDATKWCRLWWWLKIW